MPLPYWGIVQIMGHSVTAGYITEANLAGVGYIQVEIPDAPGSEELLSHGCIFRMRRTSEEEARAFAGSLRNRAPALLEPRFAEAAHYMIEDDDRDADWDPERMGDDLCSDPFEEGDF
ncbi:MAG TPA: hypothetical protein VFJ58_04580 [Armatimonadota bacterium]|nr:hypothetical protein [Armatimonadota bacterium]